MRIGVTLFATDQSIGPVELARAAEARGPTVLLGVLPDPAKLDYYASRGVTEVALRLPSAPAAPVLRALDAAVPLVARFAD